MFTLEPGILNAYRKEELYTIYIPFGGRILINFHDRPLTSFFSTEVACLFGISSYAQGISGTITPALGIAVPAKKNKINISAGLQISPTGNLSGESRNTNRASVARVLRLGIVL